MTDTSTSSSDRKTQETTPSPSPFERVETDQIAPRDVFDPSTEEFVREVRFEITVGLQSYWLQSPESHYKQGLFGITVDGSDGSSVSDESPVTDDQDQFEEQEVGSHGEPDHEGEDRGLFDWKRIDPSSEQTTQRLEALCMQ